MLKGAAKKAVQASAFLLMFPCAAFTGFGRLPLPFQLLAQIVAITPGLLGDYLRVAYYVLTLERCSPNSRICFGSFFSTTSVVVSEGVYIGAYCVIGRCRIGPRTQIATHVQILSGSRQHVRDCNGRLLGAESGDFAEIEVGADCWLGASAIIMAAVGSGTTIGAGAVVPRPIPPNVVAVGNPARVIQEVHA